jgi:CHAD domain-containing protein
VGTHTSNGNTKPDLARLLAKSLKVQWKRYRKALRKCQRSFSEESVHDSRIETRRLLARLELLGAFLPEAHLAKAWRLLKGHLDNFSALRDTQVQRLRVARMLRRFPDLLDFDHALGERERRGIKQARQAVKRFKIGRLRRLIDMLREELETQRNRTVSRRSLRAVAAAFAEVGRRRGRVEPNDTVTIHRTRVAFKHFRYMIEGLREALPRVSPARLRAMQAYQARMGQIQDVEVLMAALRKFTRQARIVPDVGRPWFAELQHQRRLLIARYLKRAGELEDFWTGADARSLESEPQRSEKP